MPILENMLLLLFQCYKSGNDAGEHYYLCDSYPAAMCQFQYLR